MGQAAKDAPAKPGAVEETLQRVNKTMDNIDRIVPANKQVQRVEVHGAGHVFGSAALGFAAGGVLVGAIIIGLWVGSTLQNINEVVRNGEAFQQATYQIAPEVRARYDKILEERRLKEAHHERDPDHHPAAQEAAANVGAG
jgi:hypothetical protein